MDSNLIQRLEELVLGGYVLTALDADGNFANKVYSPYKWTGHSDIHLAAEVEVFRQARILATKGGPHAMRSPFMARQESGTTTVAAITTEDPSKYWNKKRERERASWLKDAEKAWPGGFVLIFPDALECWYIIGPSPSRMEVLRLAFRRIVSAVSEASRPVETRWLLGWRYLVDIAKTRESRQFKTRSKRGRAEILEVIARLPDEAYEAEVRRLARNTLLGQKEIYETLGKTESRRRGAKIISGMRLDGRLHEIVQAAAKLGGDKEFDRYVEGLDLAFEPAVREVKSVIALCTEFTRWDAQESDRNYAPWARDQKILKQMQGKGFPLRPGRRPPSDTRS